MAFPLIAAAVAERSAAVLLVLASAAACAIACRLALRQRSAPAAMWAYLRVQVVIHWVPIAIAACGYVLHSRAEASGAPRFATAVVSDFAEAALVAYASECTRRRSYQRDDAFACVAGLWLLIVSGFGWPPLLARFPGFMTVPAALQAIAATALLAVGALRLSSTVGSEAWNSRDLKSRPH